MTDDILCLSANVSRHLTFISYSQGEAEIISCRDLVVRELCEVLWSEGCRVDSYIWQVTAEVSFERGTKHKDWLLPERLG